MTSMKFYLARLTEELIRFPSVDAPEHKRELNRIIVFFEKKLQRLKGCAIKKLKIRGKPALLVTSKPEHKKPKILLGGHLDVVPADPNQFEPKLKGNRLYGRGAVDMKSGCAVMIALIEALAREHQKPDVGFLFVTDEETSGETAKQLVKKGYRPELFIAVEPTDLDLVIESKGLLWMEGWIKGVAAHGSRPWLGKNPILIFHEGVQKLSRLFPQIKKDQWKTTLNIGEVKSGDCFNRTPPDLKFKLDIRYIPQDNPKAIIQKIKNCFPSSTQWNSERCDPPHPRAKNLKLIHKLKTAAEKQGAQATFKRAPYATDARFFARADIPSIVFGAKGGGMHGGEEWVDIMSLEKLFEILKDFIEMY